MAKTNGVNDGLERLRRADMKEAYEKLAKLDSNGERYTTYWRKTSFTMICSSSMSRYPTPMRDLGVDNSFRNEPSRMGFGEFRKFKLSSVE